MQKNLAVANTNFTESSDRILREDLAAASSELVIGLVGHAGAGCTSIGDALNVALHLSGYTVHRIKISKLIENEIPEDERPKIRENVEFKGADSLERAVKLQNKGDELRNKEQYILASLAIDEIRQKRGDAPVGQNKIAYILDSLKNVAEVQLFRDVYGSTFRLVAVHCDYDRRFKRLFGDIGTEAKFAGASKENVADFMTRDEMDKARNGQQVREVFHLADYFVDDNQDEKINVGNNANLKRFCEILLGSGFHRPTVEETAMYTAFSAALRSSCLSRQVGAALANEFGQIISIGSNDVPKFGGGTYLEGSTPDCRCAFWEWKSADGKIKFKGCHNSRHKNLIAEEIKAALTDCVTTSLRNLTDTESENEKSEFIAQIGSRIKADLANLSLPRVKDLVEYSRSIHAEMDALFAAARQGTSTKNTTLFCTTFPCHNCARHMVTAGVKQVFYVEPYVKSLALDLHSDSIRTTSNPPSAAPTHLAVLPFTGIGPRMYEDHFIKSGELKGPEGEFAPPKGTRPIMGARLAALESIEQQAIELIKR
jgi:deoxycytidylate deaminase